MAHTSDTRSRHTLLCRIVPMPYNLCHILASTRHQRITTLPAPSWPERTAELDTTLALVLGRRDESGHVGISPRAHRCGWESRGASGAGLGSSICRNRVQLVERIRDALLVQRCRRRAGLQAGVGRDVGQRVRLDDRDDAQAHVLRLREGRRDRVDVAPLVGGEPSHRRRKLAVRGQRVAVATREVLDDDDDRFGHRPLPLGQAAVGSIHRCDAVHPDIRSPASSRRGLGRSANRAVFSKRLLRPQTATATLPIPRLR